MDTKILITNINGNSVIECLTVIKDDEAITKPGQGIYVWALKSQLSNEKPNFKIGQYGSKGSAKLPQDTIRGYIGATIETYVIVFAVRLDDYIKGDKNVKQYKDALALEHVIHTKCVDNGGFKIDEGSSTECFGGLTLEKVKIIINDVICNVKKPESFNPRPEQLEAQQKIVSSYSRGEKEFLLAAKMRFGKNFVFLNSVKELKYKNILVISYRPQVFHDLKEIVERHVNFDGWKVEDVKENRKPVESKEVTTIFVCSAQLALNKKEDDTELNFVELRKNLNKLSKIHFDLIVADEYHYGTKTENFKELLGALKYDRLMYVSGTAMKDIAMGRFDENQIYSWSYIDEQREKKNEQDEKCEYKPHSMMPSMHFHLIKVCDEAKASKNLYEDEEGFTMTKIIGTDNTGNLKDAGSLEILLRQIIGDDVHKKMSVFRGKKANLNHTLWWLPAHVAGIKAMAKVMRLMPEYKDYEILEATGNEINDIDQVKEAINKYERTITLSCIRFAEGITIPKWDAVIMLDDSKAVEFYLQRIFRCQSPDVKRDKQDCHVFDFNPQRCLSMIYDVCENIDKTGNERLSETIREFLDYAPILDHTKNELISAEDVIKNFYETGNFSLKFANRNNYEIDKITNEEIVASLKDIESIISKKDFEVNDNQVPKGKNYKSSTLKFADKSEDTEDSKKEIEELRKKTATVLSRLPQFLFCSGEKEENVNDILNTSDTALFEECTGIKLNQFKRWVELGFLNVQRLNRNIKYFLEVIEKKLENKENKLDHADNIIRLFGLSSSEISTPTALVNEMLDQLPTEIWKNKDLKFMDPCCGTGKFLLCCFDRLMVGLSDLIKNRDARAKWIIENMLYGNDISRAKVLITRKLLAENYKDNILVKDTIKEEERVPKFDVVVGNPPYQGKKQGGGDGSGNAIWHKFVELSFDILKGNGYLCFIHPIDWRIRFDRKKIKKAQDLLFSNQMKYLKLFQTPFKGIRAIVDWYIIQKKKSEKETEICFTNGVFKSFLKKEPFPNQGGPIIDSIIRKIFTEQDNGLKRRKAFSGLVILDKTKPKGNYKFAEGTKYLSNKWKLFEYPHIHQFESKVIMNMTGPFKPIFDNGKLGIADGIHYLLVNNDNEKEAKFIITILNSKLTDFFQHIFSTHTGYLFNNPYPISRIKICEKVLNGDADVYKHFHLTKEEIDYVESQVK